MTMERVRVPSGMNIDRPLVDARPVAIEKGRRLNIELLTDKEIDAILAGPMPKR